MRYIVVFIISLFFSTGCSSFKDSMLVADDVYYTPEVNNTHFTSLLQRSTIERKITNVKHDSNLVVDYFDPNYKNNMQNGFTRSYENNNYYEDPYYSNNYINPRSGLNYCVGSAYSAYNPFGYNNPYQSINNYPYTNYNSYYNSNYNTNSNNKVYTNNIASNNKPIIRSKYNYSQTENTTTNYSRRVSISSQQVFSTPKLASIKNNLNTPKNYNIPNFTRTSTTNNNLNNGIKSGSIDNSSDRNSNKNTSNSTTNYSTGTSNSTSTSNSRNSSGSSTNSGASRNSSGRR